MNEINTRIKQILIILDKEDVLLQGVFKRLFNQEQLDLYWLQSILNSPDGIDKLESFVSKFCRMQDTFTDKLTPLFLTISGEVTSTAINNLNKLEQLDIIKNANDWIDMRLLRNKLIHEYVDDTQELLKHLLLAKQLCVKLHNSFLKIKENIKINFTKIPK